MSEIITNSATDGIQLILNDPNFISELVFDPLQSGSEETNDIIYTDASQGQLCLIDGHLLAGNMETVVLQEGDELNQYYIDAGALEVKTETEDEAVLNQQEVLQIVDEEGNIADIVYVDKDVDISQYQLVDASPKVEDDMSEPQIINMDELMDGSYETSAILENFTDENGFQYAFVKDGMLHLQQYNDDELISITDIDQLCDISVMDNAVAAQQQPLLHSSEVTGRDLNTGEVVSLDTYMNKLQGRLKSPFQTKGNRSREKRAGSCSENVKPGLNNLLNRKLFLGKTADGKRLVGKIVDIKKKDDCVTPSIGVEPPGPSGTSSTSPDSDTAPRHKTHVSEDQNNGDDDPQKRIPSTILPKERDTNRDKKIVIQKKIVSKECFQHISGTLGGLMNMDSVRKKLLNKNILVKVIEKRCSPTKKAMDKSVSYCSGYMESKVVNEEGEEVRLSWSFVPDSNTKEALYGKIHTPKSKIFSGIINITLLITYQKNKERVQVILDSDSENKCMICPRTFRTKSQLKGHLRIHHRKEEGRDDSEKNGTVCVEASEDQKKQYTTEQVTTEKKPVKTREQNMLECDMCLKRFANLSSLIAHLSTHAENNRTGAVIAAKVVQPKKVTSTNVYTCDVCKKSFSRHSNLQRHVDIHKGQGNLYQCTMCGCSYHYVSSLTRHVVQYHIKELKTM